MIKRNQDEEEYYMRQALKVAESAIEVGEVPVGCVIVLRNVKEDDSQERKEMMGKTENDSVIVSHGSNQVNATRDASRHAECIAIDRIMMGGMRDRNRLPQPIICQAAHGSIPQNSALKEEFHDELVNVSSDKTHWKNTYGWGSGRTYNKDIFKKCDLYVTCEPCIMVS